MTRLNPSVLAAVALLCAPLSGVEALAEETQAPRPFLTVRGEGRSKARPEVARLVVVLSTKGAGIAEASRAHGPRAKDASALLERLSAGGVTVKEGNFTLGTEREYLPNPHPERPGPPPKIVTTGVATTRFDVEVRPVDGLDAAVSALAESGLVEIREVAYALDRPEAETDKARRLAMADALAQGKLYAEAGGFRLVSIVGVSDGQSGPSMAPDVPMRAMASSAAPMQASAPATIDTQSSVSVTWRIDGGAPAGTPR